MGIILGPHEIREVGKEKTSVFIADFDVSLALGKARGRDMLLSFGRYLEKDRQQCYSTTSQQEG